MKESINLYRNITESGEVTYTTTYQPDAKVSKLTEWWLPNEYNWEYNNVNNRWCLNNSIMNLHRPEFILRSSGPDQGNLPYLFDETGTHFLTPKTMYT